MSTVLEPEVIEGELLLPEPVGKQIEWLDSQAKYKVLRVGRRGTKTRFAFLAAMAGHGPGWDEATPSLKGILQGGDVVWLAQTYTNLSMVLWREEIVPRMGHLPWVNLNTTKHDVEIPGLGALMLRSADREAIDSVRGVGKRLLGVIIDEAAWLDLRGALQDVIMPALLDNGGWLIIMSTTNAGPDGGYDDAGAPQVPSYFNIICQQIRAKERSQDWQEFYGTAFDNPTLDPKAINDLIAEYPPDSPKLKQEVFAELLKAGIGLALPELSDKHIVPKERVPSHYTQFGAFDWGFNHPWVFGWYAVDEDGNVIKVDTIWGREQLPDAIGDVILAGCPPVKDRRFIVHAGHDIFTKKGKSVGFTGPTIAEKLQAKGLKLIPASTDRVNGLDNLRRYVHPNAEGVDPFARFTLMNTEGNRKCLSQLQSMQIDPDNLEDALKIDADAAGRGGDDSYDETRYGLMSRPLTSKPVHVDTEREGVSVGYDYEKGRPRVRQSAEDVVSQMIERARPNVTAGRYRVPRR